MRKLFSSFFIASMFVALMSVMVSCDNKDREPEVKPLKINGGYYFGDYYYTGGEHFSIGFVTDGVSVVEDDGELLGYRFDGTGYVVAVDFTSVADDDVTLPSEGNYVVSAEGAKGVPGTASKGYPVDISEIYGHAPGTDIYTQGCFVQVIQKGVAKPVELAEEGNIMIEKKGSKYAFSIRLKSAGGKERTFAFEGALYLKNQVRDPYPFEPETTKEFSPEMKQYAATNFGDVLDQGNSVVLLEMIDSEDDNNFNQLFSALLFVPSDFETLNGAYPFESSFATGTSLASPGNGTDGDPYFSYFIDYSEMEAYYLRSGSVIIENGLITVDAVSAKGSAVKISFEYEGDLSVTDKTGQSVPSGIRNLRSAGGLPLPVRQTK